MLNTPKHRDGIFSDFKGKVRSLASRKNPNIIHGDFITHKNRKGRVQYFQRGETIATPLYPPL